MNETYEKRIIKEAFWILKILFRVEQFLSPITRIKINFSLYYLKNIGTVTSRLKIFPHVSKAC